MGASENEQAVRRYWDEFWTKGNLAAAADFYAPKYRENGEELTPEEFAAGSKSWLDKFENFSATVEKLWACGDKVVASRVRYRAKHIGDFKSVPATGKEIEITGNDIFEFDQNGKVVDHWHEADHLLLYQQVGGEIQPRST